jgi:hypothetical protein
MHVVPVVLFANGLYDVLCSVCILSLSFSAIAPFSYLSKLHLTMFAKKADMEHPVARRFLAYWVLTYGLVRLAAGFVGHVLYCPLIVCAGMTYFVEAAAFAFEASVGHMVLWKVQFVVASSVGWGGFVVFSVLYQKS